MPLNRLQIIATLLALGGLSLLWPLTEARLSGGEVQSVTVVDRHGEVLREIRPDGRSQPLDLDKIAPAFLDAVIAIEDQHFRRHPGINPVALLRAAKDNVLEGEVVSGASTLTMQVARMLRGRPHRSWLQKIAEMHLAVRLEVYLTKDEILSLWANRAYFGNQAYGVEAAAQLYFGKPAQDLTLLEASYLAGLPQRPTSLNPFVYPEAAQSRQARVLTAMATTGVISAQDFQHLTSLPVTLQPPAAHFQAAHLVEYLWQAFSTRPDPPKRIETTIDAPLQRDIEALARSHLERLEYEQVGNAAAIVLDNATGEVLAYMGSVDYWDEAALGQNDGVRMRRQPGSALKPFTYALALQSKRYTPQSILPDIEVHIPEAGGAFSPKNYDKQYHGPTPLRVALASSYNVPAVRIAREFGSDQLLDLLHQFGFASLQKPPEHYGVGLTLGNGEVRLIELARAYAGLANLGQLPSLKAILHDDIKDVKLHAPPLNSEAQFAMSPEIAALLTDVLQDPLAREPAFGRYGPLELPFPTAVKTGTSKDYRDNWAVGFTPAHTVAVWTGNFDGSPMRKVSGVSGAGPLFKAIMLRLGSGGSFSYPASLEQHTVCPISGKAPGEHCPHLATEMFLAGTQPTATCDVHQLLKIDKRSGLLANQHTPDSFAEDVLFVVHPDEYHPWMRAQNLPFPPAPSSMVDAPALPTLAIAFPTSGTLFQLDPVLRRSFQKIQLEGIAPAGFTQPQWWVDDQVLDQPFDHASWTMTPGAHVFQIRALDPDGQWHRSQPATITVVDIPKEAHLMPSEL